MTWRVIVRMSITGEKKDASVLYGRVAKCLKDCGIKKSEKTDTVWEGEAVSARNAAEQLAAVFELFTAQSKIRGRAELSHLLIYIDRVRTSKASSSPAKT